MASLVRHTGNGSLKLTTDLFFHSILKHHIPIMLYFRIINYKYKYYHKTLNHLFLSMENPIMYKYNINQNIFKIYLIPTCISVDTSESVVKH